MLFTAKCAWVCSESYILQNCELDDITRVEEYNTCLVQVKKEMSDAWDRTRFKDDPQKHKIAFSNDGGQYIHILINNLKYL